MLILKTFQQFSMCDNSSHNINFYLFLCVLLTIQLCNFVQLSDSDGGLNFLINTVMNPWVADKDKIEEIGTAFRQTVLDAIGKVCRYLY